MVSTVIPSNLRFCSESKISRVWVWRMAPNRWTLIQYCSKLWLVSPFGNHTLHFMNSYHEQLNINGEIVPVWLFSFFKKKTLMSTVHPEGKGFNFRNKYVIATELHMNRQHNKTLLHYFIIINQATFESERQWVHFDVKFLFCQFRLYGPESQIIITSMCFAVDILCPN